MRLAGFWGLADWTMGSRIEVMHWMVRTADVGLCRLPVHPSGHDTRFTLALCVGEGLCAERGDNAAWSWAWIGTLLIPGVRNIVPVFVDMDKAFGQARLARSCQREESELNLSTNAACLAKRNKTRGMYDLIRPGVVTLDGVTTGRRYSRSCDTWLP
nr:hypothetical protein CFP56_04271 [Quercus suber]